MSTEDNQIMVFFNYEPGQENKNYYTIVQFNKSIYDQRKSNNKNKDNFRDKKKI